eukprot:XP_011668536.1 PREDICTED: LOW QUALITY PROTEIN: mitochondrial import inner membrane translocase subunit Tim23-like [Strongylocentrotus purpuratus]
MSKDPTYIRSQRFPLTIPECRSHVSESGLPNHSSPNGQARTRGRFELAFLKIGSSCLAGALYGAVNGLRISGVETKELAGRVRMSQMLTLVTKQGASSANSIGVVALMYTIFGIGLSWSRGTDDEINTLGAATMTGMLYKSSAGAPKMLRGGARWPDSRFTCTALQNRIKVSSMMSGNNSQY